LIERAQTTLRQVVGARNLQGVISEREAIALEIEEILETVSEKWGVAVESVLIKVRPLPSVLYVLPY
jgi:erythrocyte band 7 integral membrane protein